MVQSCRLHWYPLKPVRKKKVLIANSAPTLPTAAGHLPISITGADPSMLREHCLHIPSPLILDVRAPVLLGDSKAAWSGWYKWGQVTG